MKRKSECCEKYRRKKKACKDCPILAQILASEGGADKKARKKALRRLKAA